MTFWSCEIHYFKMRNRLTLVKYIKVPPQVWYLHPLAPMPPKWQNPWTKVYSCLNAKATLPLSHQWLGCYGALVIWERHQQPTFQALPDDKSGIMKEEPRLRLFTSQGYISFLRIGAMLWMCHKLGFSWMVQASWRVEGSIATGITMPPKWHKQWINMPALERIFMHTLCS